MNKNEILRGFAAVGDYEASLTATQRATIKKSDAEHKAKQASATLPSFYQRDTGLSPTLLRCALFGSEQRGTRGIFNRREPKVLHSAHGDHITFVGEELRQDDEGVLLALIKMAAAKEAYLQETYELTVNEACHIRYSATRSADRGSRLMFTPRALVKYLGWSSSGVNVDKLKECVRRLKEAYVVIKYANGDESSLSFIADYKFTVAGEVWTIDLADSLVDVFAKKKTFLNVADRLKLKEGMQTWLFGFVNADSCKGELALSDMRTWAGSTATQKEFNRVLKAALETLETLGMIEAFAMKRFSLSITR